MNKLIKAMTSRVILVNFLTMGFLIIGCSSKPETQAEKETRWVRGDLNSYEYEHGIGPITENPEVGSVDPGMAEQGKAIFVQKCATCHYLDMRKTGPGLRDVSKRRSAAYIMNQVLNPDQMGKLHPDGKKLVAQYAQYMTLQGITPEMARQLLEFLRSEADKPALPSEQQPGFGTLPTSAPAPTK